MSQFIWSDEYSVNVEEMDFHHKRVFSIINRLRKALNEGEEESLAEILEELQAYATYHLEKEESYFVKFNFQEKEDHEQIHDQYQQYIKDFISQEESQKDYSQLLAYLEKWWLNHVLKVDKKYSKTFNDNGLY